MSIAEKYLASFCEGGIYHVYNRTNNKELLFRSGDNYHFFLRKYFQYLSPFVSTFCYNLLPNHFHLVIRIKSIREITAYLDNIEKEQLITAEILFLTDPEKHLDKLIESAFHRFFTSYSMAFNKMFDRKGNLFHRPFKRIEIKEVSHLFKLIIYVHANEVKHGLTKNFETDRGNHSYLSILSVKPTALLRQEILNLFGGADKFITTHRGMVKYYYDAEFAVED